MITISKIETYVLKDTLEKSFFFSQWEYSERCICIVKITCSDGTYGWGEGYGPANILESGIEFLKAQVLGENPLHNEVIWNKMYRKTLDFARRGVLVASMSAIDIAIWDIKGKLLNQSVGSLLGGVQRKYVVPYATGMYFTEKDNLTKDFEVEAKLYLEKGFKAIKMKVGLGIAKDVNNVKHLRSIIGYDIKLMIDSNHAYTYTEALELSKKLEKYEISWFEEPVSPEFYEQYAELRQKIRQEFGNDQAQMTDASLLILFTADMKAWQQNPQRYWQNAPEQVAELLVNWMGPFHEGKEWLQRDEAQRSIGMAMQT